MSLSRSRRIGRSQSTSSAVCWTWLCIDSRVERAAADRPDPAIGKEAETDFYRAPLNAGRSSQEKVVCPSVKCAVMGSN